MAGNYRPGWVLFRASTRVGISSGCSAFPSAVDPYLRPLLIHGARAVVYRSSNKADARNRWIADKQKRLGSTKACVAVANKNARIIWALLAKDEEYLRAA